jgi:hypothetical protein
MTHPKMNSRIFGSKTNQIMPSITGTPGKFRTTTKQSIPHSKPVQVISAQQKQKTKSEIEPHSIGEAPSDTNQKIGGGG